MRVDVGGGWGVDEGNKGCGVGGVEDGHDGRGGVIGGVDWDLEVGEPFPLCLRISRAQHLMYL